MSAKIILAMLGTPRVVLNEALRLVQRPGIFAEAGNKRRPEPV
jgi:hypothetical protein